MKLRQIPPVPAVLLAIVSVQGGAAIAKNLFPLLGPITTVGLRIVLSAIILLIAFRPKLSKFTKQQWKAVIPYGLALGAMNLSFYLSLARIPLGLAVTLEFIGPLALAVSKSKRAIDFLWVALAAIGIALITPWHGDANFDLIGAFLALIAGAFWALYIVLGGKTSKLIDGNSAVAVGLSIASLLILPFVFFDGQFIKLNGNLLLMGIAVALFSSAVPFTLEMKALKVIPPKTFSILMSLEPAAAAFFGLLFLSEKLSIFEWLAIAFVILASLGATLSKKTATSSNTDK